MDRPQVIKGALKFKSNQNSHKKTTVALPTKKEQEAKR